LASVAHSAARSDIHAGARTIHHGTAQLGIGHGAWGGEVQVRRAALNEPVQRPKRMGLGAGSVLDSQAKTLQGGGTQLVPPPQG
jgi:hypothetical protein